MTQEELAEADEYIRTHSVADILNDLFLAYLTEGITLEEYDELRRMVLSYVPKRKICFKHGIDCY